MLLIAFSQVFSQQATYIAYDWEFESLQYTPIPYIPDQNVSEIKFNTLKKGKVISVDYKKFNQEGKLLEYKEEKGGKEKRAVSVLYDDYGYPREVEYKKNGSPKKKTQFKRLENGKPLSQVKYNGKGDIKISDEWIYAGDCLKERYRYRGDDKKLDFKYVYEHRNECEPSKTTLYNGKGKVKKVWTFDCKQEGEILEKKKNTTQVCKWEESEDGILIKVYQTFDDKGRVVKNVSKFTSEDTLILEILRYYKEDQLSYKATYDRDYKKPLTQTSYKKNGQVRYTWNMTYDGDRITSRSFGTSKKEISRAEYIYNDKELLAEYKSIGRNGNLRWQVNLEYTP